MRISHLLLIFFLTSLMCSCDKDKPKEAECIQPMIVPFQPYSHPVWHPNGNLLGFNYTPLAGITPNGKVPCTWYFYAPKSDSAGFYLMNKDGSGFRRVTNFQLFAPAWSPDGNWIAFSVGSQLYKMRYTGTGFDTANIVQLTNNGGNFHPSWTANSDSIYFDSNISTSGETSFYTIWKMAGGGAGKQKVFDATGLGDIRYPFVGSNSKLYHVRYISSQPEIFSMNKDASEVQQLTFNGKYGNRNEPTFIQGNLLYNDNGTLRRITSSGTETNLVNPSVTYDVSSNNEIVYSKMVHSIIAYNPQIGTLWIMNLDGSNNRQLTFNHL